jgi:hypothetical protein
VKLGDRPAEAVTGAGDDGRPARESQLVSAPKYENVGRSIRHPLSMPPRQKLINVLGALFIV